MRKMKVADTEKVEKQLTHIIINDEILIKAFKLTRDFMVFTNLRVILVDKKGITGKTKEFLSIPYRSIDYWTVESRGNSFEIDGDFKLFVRGLAAPVVRDFKSQDALYEVQKVLVTYCK